MNAQTKKNVFEALTAFADQDGSALGAAASVGGAVQGDDPLALSEETLSSLHTLEVFHQEFKLTEALPQPKEVVKTYEDGLAEGEAVARKNMADDLAMVQAVGQEINNNLHTLGQQIEASHSRSISSLLRSVLPTLCEKMVGQEIEAFLKTISAQAIFGQVSLDIHPDAEEQIAPLIEALTNTQNKLMFEISTNPDLAKNDVKASWHGGEARIETDTALEKIMAILDDMICPKPEAQSKTLSGPQAPHKIDQ